MEKLYRICKTSPRYRPMKPSFDDSCYNLYEVFRTKPKAEAVKYFKTTFTLELLIHLNGLWLSRNQIRLLEREIKNETSVSKTKKL